jgi:hypothetical protein
MTFVEPGETSASVSTEAKRIVCVNTCKTSA